MAENFVEYRVIPVTRFIVTRYSHERSEGGESAAGVSEKGEFQNGDVAYEVARAMAEGERMALGYALDDPRMKYPIVPGSLCNPKNPPETQKQAAHL